MRRPDRIMAGWLRALAVAVLLGGAMQAAGQTSLAGRVYYNENIMKAAADDALKDMDKQVAEARTKAIAKQEKEKGRKLTADEKAELELKIQEAIKTAKMMAGAMKTKATVEFKSSTEVAVTMDMSVDDNALKTAGIGWLKRKAMKAAMAMAPKTEKGTYVVKGNLVITTTGKDKDTLRLSADGKHLYGTFEKDVHFTLTRTK